jgi:hypothetical protein
MVSWGNEGRRKVKERREIERATKQLIRQAGQPTDGEKKGRETRRQRTG